MDDLYREVIIEHYKNPGYRGHLDPHDIQFEDNNPLCGDHIEITLQTAEDGTVKDARFDGHGCAISQASADLLIESIIGKPIEEVKKLNQTGYPGYAGDRSRTCPLEVCAALAESIESWCVRSGRGKR